MGDVGEDMRAFRAHGKLKAKEREIINTIAIATWCGEKGISFKVIADWQIRVFIKGIAIDIFPQSKKYHNISKNERGKINGKITDFLTNLL